MKTVPHCSSPYMVMYRRHYTLTPYTTSQQNNIHLWCSKCKTWLEFWPIWGGLTIVCTIKTYIIPLVNNNGYLPANYNLMISALIHAIIRSRELNYADFVYYSMYSTTSSFVPNRPYLAKMTTNQTAYFQSCEPCEPTVTVTYIATMITYGSGRESTLCLGLHEASRYSSLHFSL
jgi:hypothetical protein